MQLKLKELQRVAKATIKEEKFRNDLREELFRLFGPPVMVSKNYEVVAAATDEHLDLLEATGRLFARDLITTTVFLEAMQDKSTVVRKIAARLLPTKYVVKMTADRSSSVRCAAAKRLPYKIVKEAVKRNPGDDQLATIARSKRVSESGIPTPKVSDDPFDMYGDEALGLATKQNPGPELSEEWYKRLATKLCKEYGSNLEGQWEEILATRVVASHYATSGIKIDRDRLLKSIYDCLESRDDAVLGEGSLKLLARTLRNASHLDEVALPVIDDAVNPVVELTESNLSSSQYIKRAEEIFSIKKSAVPAGIKKYRIGEGHNFETLIPVNGKVPDGKITAVEERALDGYVSRWNDHQSVKGEPYRIEWSPSPGDASRIGFHVELK